MGLEGLVLYGLAVVLIVSVLLSSLMLKRTSTPQKSTRIRLFGRNLLSFLRARLSILTEEE